MAMSQQLLFALLVTLHLGISLAACPSSALLNGQGLCLCNFDTKCTGSSCQLGLTTSNPPRLISYFGQSCTDCECEAVQCPAGSVANVDGTSCICRRQGSSGTTADYNSACQGAFCRRSFTYQGSQIAFIDHFPVICSDCECFDCPMGTLKDSDGDCQCPLHSYCVGSDKCTESVIQTSTINGQTYSIGDHIHYFQPPCEDCVCDSDALDGFVKIPNSHIEGYDLRTYNHTVAAKCAELCLDDDKCLSFEASRAPDVNGLCILQRVDRETPGAQLSPRNSRDYYERRDLPNICDDNGGCGLLGRIECERTGRRSRRCIDIDECMFNNTCTAGQICVNNFNASATCLDPSTSHPCDLPDTCSEGGMCVKKELCQCPGGASTCTECSNFECVITCDDQPCAQNSVCRDTVDLSKLAAGEITIPEQEYECTCAPGFKPGPDGLNGDGSGCIAVTQCDPHDGITNGNCGPTDKALCGTTTAGEVKCACLPGWEGHMCMDAICANPCVHGSCSMPGGKCECDDGYSGDACSVPDCDVATEDPACKSTNPCLEAGCSDNSVCHATPSGATCVCNEGWSGDTCHIPACSSDCSAENGYCNAPGECICKTGFGPAGKCNEAVCREGCVFGVCPNQPGGCQCIGLWAGELCDRCSDGTTRSVDGTECVAICGDGKLVSSQEECDDGNTISGDGCSSNCKVEAGFDCTKPELGKSICTDPNDCESNPCGDKARCLDNKPPLRGYSCECLPAYDGAPGPDGSGCMPRCSGEDGRVWSVCGRPCTRTCHEDCADVDQSLCASGRCQCPTSKPVWHDNMCITEQEASEQCTNTEADCNDDSNGPNGMGCKNGGVCVEGTAGDGSFTCDCRDIEFTGDNCETFFPDTYDPSNGPNGRDCANNARRVDIVRNDGEFVCDCSGTGFTGANCETADCSQVDCDSLGRQPCSSLPQTCGACKTGLVADSTEPNSMCKTAPTQAPVISTVFVLNADYDSVLGVPATPTRRSQVVGYVQAGILNAGVSLDGVTRIELSRGSVIVTVISNRDTGLAIQDEVAAGNIKVTIDGTVYTACSAGHLDKCSSSDAPKQSESKGSSSSSNAGMLAGVIVAVLVLTAIAIALGVVYGRSKGRNGAQPPEVVAYTSPFVDDTRDHFNPMYGSPSDSGSVDIPDYGDDDEGRVDFGRDGEYMDISTSGRPSGEYLDIAPPTEDE